MYSPIARNLRLEIRIPGFSNVVVSRPKFAPLLRELGVRVKAEASALVIARVFHVQREGHL